MELNFCSGAYETFSKNLNAQECTNFFTHVDSEGGVSKLSLRGTPGLKEWYDTGHYAEVRGVHEFGNSVYAVVGNRVYRVYSDTTAITCTKVPDAVTGVGDVETLDTSDGPVSMADNGVQLMIVDGMSGYIIEGIISTKITDGSFPANPETVTYQDSYFIVSIHDSNYCYISDTADGTAWDSTQNIAAGGYSDNVIAIISDNKNLYLMGNKTIESFYNSGGDPAFTYRPGSIQSVGIGARHSVANLDNTLFFLTDKYQVARYEGNNPIAKSTRSVEYQIAQYEKKSDAIGMGIMIEGNSFYVLTFPTANETWCFNVATGFWNKLTSYPYEQRWRGNCHAYFKDKSIVGDYKNGKLYEWDFDTYKDNSEDIRRIRVASAVKQDGKRVFHNQLELFFESGIGLISGQGSDPMAMLQYSDDGGHTWSSETWRSAGKIGKYGWRAIWNRLGASRQRYYKLTVNDPVKWVVTGANLEVQVGTT